MFLTREGKAKKHDIKVNEDEMIVINLNYSCPQSG
jgi:hypothetical protein